MSTLNTRYKGISTLSYMEKLRFFFEIREDPIFEKIRSTDQKCNFSI